MSELPPWLYVSRGQCCYMRSNYKHKQTENNLWTSVFGMWQAQLTHLGGWMLSSELWGIRGALAGHWVPCTEIVNLPKLMLILPYACYGFTQRIWPANPKAVALLKLYEVSGFSKHLRKLFWCFPQHRNLQLLRYVKLPVRWMTVTEWHTWLFHFCS